MDKASRRRDMYIIDTPGVSDDTHLVRLFTVSQTVDGTYLRQLVAAAHAAGVD